MIEQICGIVLMIVVISLVIWVIKKPCPVQERHNCCDCVHYFHSVMRGSECWRNGKHSYITGDWDNNVCSCRANIKGYCHWWKDRTDE